ECDFPEARRRQELRKNSLLIDARDCRLASASRKVVVFDNEIAGCPNGVSSSAMGQSQQRETRGPWRAVHGAPGSVGQRPLLVTMWSAGWPQTSPADSTILIAGVPVRQLGPRRRRSATFVASMPELDCDRCHSRVPVRNRDTERAKNA